MTQRMALLMSMAARKQTTQVLSAYQHTLLCSTPLPAPLYVSACSSAKWPHMYLLSQSRVFSETAGKLVAGLLMRSS